jgi:hypothetical protein
VVVPHEREALLERVWREQAAIEPPGFESFGISGIGGGLTDDGGEGIEICGDAFEAGLAVEESLDGGSGSIGEVALDFGPGGAERGPAVEVDDALDVPGGVGCRLIGGPGGHGLFWITAISLRTDFFIGDVCKSLLGNGLRNSSARGV